MELAFSDEKVKYRRRVILAVSEFFGVNFVTLHENCYIILTTFWIKFVPFMQIFIG